MNEFEIYTARLLDFKIFGLFLYFCALIIFMGRIIGIDWGLKRIGLAVTDPLHIFASPLITVSTPEFDSFIRGYLKTEEVEAFVIGYPVQMNNKPSESVNYINPFIKKIKKEYPEKHIYLADERFTSQMALRTMIDGGVKKKDRQNKSMVDKISASIILQSFLDNRSNKTENNKQI
jgi:putative holliday junction resolvase